MSEGRLEEDEERMEPQDRDRDRDHDCDEREVESDNWETDGGVCPDDQGCI